MIKLRYSILLTILMVSVSTLDYDAQHTVNCNLINDTWTLTQNLEYLWSIVILHDIDRFTFLIVCPVIFCFQMMLIMTFVKYRLYKSSPMDIIAVFFFCESAINIDLFIAAVYYTTHSVNKPMPQHFPEFCLGTAIINTFFNILQQIYLIYFLFHVLFSVNKSIKKNKLFDGKAKHILALSIAIFFTGLIGGFNWLGLSQFGICEITSTRNNETQIYFPVIQLTFSFAFLCLAFFTYKYFRKHMPEGQALNKRKFQQNQLITRFVIGMSIILTLFSAAMLVLYLNCISPSPLNLIWATIFNLTKLVQFSYLIIVMMYYKKIGNKVKKLFRRLFKNTNVKSSMTINEKRLTKKQLFDFNDIGIKQKILDIQQQENQIDFITITQIMTILTGINIAYRQYFLSNQPLTVIKDLYFHEQVAFNIDSNLIKLYEKQASILPRLSLVKGKFTIFSPRIFNQFLYRDKIHEVWQSFDLIKNCNQLYKLYQCDGGKSGQFFFFTSDNKYILKTINKQQFTFLLQYLQEFYNHFINYPDSLITKIYGMFKIENKDINQSYYILLMKNISGCDRDQILRIYDLKGSTYDRQILKDYEDQTVLQNKNGFVLKDVDFQNIEGNLEINNSYSKKLRIQLQIDTQFLKDLNIIDYSLLVMRVCWQTPPKNPNFWGKLNRIPLNIQTNQNENQFYHISLIDYLQKWDLQKQSEKWWKNLMGNKNTSAAQPSTYQSRFMNFIKSITIGDSDRGTLNLNSLDPTNSVRLTQLAEVGQSPDRLYQKSQLFLESNFKKSRAITQVR